jgi:hypothetical protein
MKKKWDDQAAAAAYHRMMQSITGVSTLVRGNPGERELAPELVKWLTENETTAEGWVECSNTDFGFKVIEVRLLDGRRLPFTPNDLRHFQKNKRFYTSPLYKALL